MLTRGSTMGADSSFMDYLLIGLTLDCSGSRFLMFCVIVIVLYHYSIMIRDVSLVCPLPCLQVTVFRRR